ncbi:putative membrane protein YphA (DoxX/SURF4 family) [Cytobacillus eiseniae]|uniref:Membrane protein YphA (DoxX/SURF4 family) n=1 Tax=Cytobacillus eiseniae TaxID=762947 RepID=A0ABS4RJT9_9BACI|nr:DoxX family protein [Cytobacillus eiseniae]MBP2242681.1 putative membrane protein YphA (DoxX/SURF4 family) [Cytobacillus eiseniae]
MTIYSTMSSVHYIRYAVAYVFIISGLMKFINEELSHSFISLGLPYPLTLMYIVALLEIICGMAILMNKYIKHATIPLIIIMIGAVLLTKIPILHTGFMAFAFQARLDIIMLVLLTILYSQSTKRL